MVYQQLNHMLQKDETYIGDVYMIFSKNYIIKKEVVSRTINDITMSSIINDIIQHITNGLSYYKPLKVYASISNFKTLLDSRNSFEYFIEIDFLSNSYHMRLLLPTDKIFLNRLDYLISKEIDFETAILPYSSIVYLFFKKVQLDVDSINKIHKITISDLTDYEPYKGFIEKIPIKMITTYLIKRGLNHLITKDYLYLTYYFDEEGYLHCGLYDSLESISPNVLVEYFWLNIDYDISSLPIWNPIL